MLCSNAHCKQWQPCMRPWVALLVAKTQGFSTVNRVTAASNKLLYAAWTGTSVQLPTYAQPDVTACQKIELLNMAIQWLSCFALFLGLCCCALLHSALDSCLAFGRTVLLCTCFGAGFCCAFGCSSAFLYGRLGSRFADCLHCNMQHNVKKIDQLINFICFDACACANAT